MRALHSGPKYLWKNSKASSPNTFAPEISFQHMNFWGYTNIQVMASGKRCEEESIDFIVSLGSTWFSEDKFQSDTLGP